MPVKKTRTVVHETADYTLSAEMTPQHSPPGFYCLEFKSVFRTAKNPTEERSLLKIMATSSGMTALGSFIMFSALQKPGEE